MHRARRDNRPFTAKKTGIGTGLTGGFPDNTGEIQAIYRDGSAFSRIPHGEERASARVSNHGQLAPLSPAARPSRRRCAPPQRLCCLSSVLPWRLVPDHGVEDGEEFTGDRDEGDHFRLSCREEALIEGLQDRVVLAGRESGHIDCGACGSAATGNHALALPTTGLTRERCHPDEAGDMTTREATEFRNLSQEATRGFVGHARDGDHEILVRAPNRRAADQAADVIADGLQLLFQHLDVAVPALADSVITATRLALSFVYHPTPDL